uniref:F-box domain-containing protein n=1 Tax=Pristionchus pacificus TaxID=54126 RepID=A0A8R1YBS1_PRIPA
MDAEPAAKRGRHCEKPARIGAMDFLTSMDDDCLMSILGCVNRSTFDVLQILNQRMNELTNRRGIVKPKHSRILSIVQDRSCHAVYLDPIIKNTHSSLSYKVSARNTDIPKETRKVMKTRFIDKKAQWHVLSAIHIGPKEVEMPLIFEHIHSVQKENNIDIVNLQKIDIDGYFVQRYLETFKGNYPKDVRFIACTFSGILDGTKAKNFFLQAKMERISIKAYSGGSRYHGPFTQQFLEEFVAQSNGCALSATIVDSFDEEKLMGGIQWIPSPDFLPVICEFSRLELGDMRLNNNQVQNVIKLRLDLPIEEDVNWRFYLSEDLDLNNINKTTHTVTKRDVTVKMGEHNYYQRSHYYISKKIGRHGTCKITYNYRDLIPILIEFREDNSEW